MIQNTRRAVAVRLLRHHLVDQPPEGLDAGRPLARPKSGAVNVPGRKIGPGAAAFVLVFDAHRSPPPGAWGWMRRRA